MGCVGGRSHGGAHRSWNLSRAAHPDGPPLHLYSDLPLRPVVHAPIAVWTNSPGSGCGPECSAGYSLFPQLLGVRTQSSCEVPVELPDPTRAYLWHYRERRLCRFSLHAQPSAEKSELATAGKTAGWAEVFPDRSSVQRARSSKKYPLHQSDQPYLGRGR